MKGMPKLHVLYDHQLNTYLTVDSVAKLSQKLYNIAHILVRDIQTIDFVKNNRTH